MQPNSADVSPSLSVRGVPPICLLHGCYWRALARVAPGPRLNVCTPFSTNAVSICESITLGKVSRIECSRRVSVKVAGTDLSTLSAADKDTVAVSSAIHAGALYPAGDRCSACVLAAAGVTVCVVNCARYCAPQRMHVCVCVCVQAVLYDRMTECVYTAALDSFALANVKEAWSTVDVLGKGTPALKAASDKLGLAFDDADLAYYTKLFSERIKRNPTTVECFDLSQSNSEHSRHWFFTGRLIIDGAEQVWKTWGAALLACTPYCPHVSLPHADPACCLLQCLLRFMLLAALCSK